MRRELEMKNEEMIKKFKDVEEDKTAWVFSSHSFSNLFLPLFFNDSLFFNLLGFLLLFALSATQHNSFWALDAI